MVGFAEWVTSVVWYAMYGTMFDPWFVYVTLFGCSFSFVWTVMVAAVAGSLTHVVRVAGFRINLFFLVFDKPFLLFDLLWMDTWPSCGFLLH